MVGGLESEKAVLGILLINSKEYAGTIFEALATDDFINTDCKIAFSKMHDMFMTNVVIDLVTVLSALGNDSKHFLTECIEYVTSCSSCKQYIQLVKDNSKKQKANAELLNLSIALESGDLNECQDTAEKICSILSDTQSQDVSDMTMGLNHFYDTKAKPKTYIQTGFKTLDRFTYIDKGDYVIIGGKPSSGKTAFALNIGLKMSEKYNVVFFSLETSQEKIFDRLVCAYADIKLSNIKRQTMADDDWERLAKASDKMSKLNFKRVKAAGRTTSWIKAKALQLKADVIIIDYISLVKGEGKNLYEKVTNISVDLHTMAQQLNITVIALSQLNRATTGEPDMESLKESSQLEQDGDLILMLHNPNDGAEEENYERICKIVKNKEGEVGKLKFKFYGETQKFYCEEVRY